MMRLVITMGVVFLVALAVVLLVMPHTEDRAFPLLVIIGGKPYWIPR